MKTSPQWKDALVRNLNKLNTLPTELIQSGTMYGVYRKDYPAYKQFQKKHSSFFRYFFLQKA